MTTRHSLTTKEAEDLITRVGPSLGCGDHTYGPQFPEERDDVCAVRRMAENGTNYGYDTIYLVWKDKDGRLQYRELANSSSTKDYLYIEGIKAEGERITVKLSNGGAWYSGNPWESEHSSGIG
ncbi:MAG: hypothetical protein ACREGR_03885 [Minisyncoccia bacterium]